MLNLTDLEKKRLRAAAARQLADNATTPEEWYNASQLASKLRARIYQIETGLPTVAGTVHISARAGLGRIRLHLACLLIRELDGWLSTIAHEWSFKLGDYDLPWAARADRADRIRQVVPAFLADVDQTALEAARAHRAYLRTLPEEHHHPSQRENLVRSYRRIFMNCYGAALMRVITLGHRPDIDKEIGLPKVKPGSSPVLDAFNTARTADTRRYGLQAPPRVIELTRAP